MWHTVRCICSSTVKKQMWTNSANNADAGPLLRVLGTAFWQKKTGEKIWISQLPKRRLCCCPGCSSIQSFWGEKLFLQTAVLVVVWTAKQRAFLLAERSTMFEVLKSSSLLDLICLLFSRGTKKLPNGTAAGIKEMGLMGVCCLIGWGTTRIPVGFYSSSTWLARPYCVIGITLSVLNSQSRPMS